MHNIEKFNLSRVKLSFGISLKVHLTFTMYTGSLTDSVVKAEVCDGELDELLLVLVGSLSWLS